MKAFNQEKALLGALSAIDCENYEKIYHWLMLVEHSVF